MTALGQTDAVHRRALALFVALAAIVVGACGRSSSGDTVGGAATTQAAVPGNVEVVTRTETFVDTTRTTEEPNPAPERTLVTTIRYPDRGGPYPLVVFAHGANGHPRKFVKLTTAWAEAGYVVAAPAFPNSNDEAPGGIAVEAYAHQPGDMSFVIDEVLALAAAPDSRLRDRIDGDRIGVAGFSLGAASTYGVTFHACCRDERIDAAVAMAGVLLPYTPGGYELAGVPLLIVHGDADPALSVELDAATYARAAPPKVFVTIHGGGHAGPFEDAVTPADSMVETATTAFWDAYLGEQPGALDRLLTDAAVPGLTTVQHDTG
jgi:predicted dienelactone hydrolase